MLHLPSEHLQLQSSEQDAMSKNGKFVLQAQSYLETVLRPKEKFKKYLFFLHFHLGPPKAGDAQMYAGGIIGISDGSVSFRQVAAAPGCVWRLQ